MKFIDENIDIGDYISSIKTGKSFKIIGLGNLLLVNSKSGFGFAIESWNPSTNLMDIEYLLFEEAKHDYVIFESDDDYLLLMKSIKRDQSLNDIIS